MMTFFCFFCFFFGYSIFELVGFLLRNTKFTSFFVCVALKLETCHDIYLSAAIYPLLANARKN